MIKIILYLIFWNKLKMKQIFFFLNFYTISRGFRRNHIYICRMLRKLETKNYQMDPSLFYHWTYISFGQILQVQRSAQDPSFLVATYEGEHNHMQPNSGIEYQLVGPIQLGSNKLESSVSSPPSMRSPSSSSVDTLKASLPSTPQILVQQMASFLTRDPNFTTALATAITGTMVDN